MRNVHLYVVYFAGRVRPSPMNVMGVYLTLYVWVVEVVLTTVFWTVQQVTM